MDTVRKHIQATGPLRSNHLNAFYKAHPDIPRKGSGAGQWIATRAEKYGIVVKKPAKYGGPLEFQLAPSNSRKLNIVADRQDDRPPTQLPKKDKETKRREKLEQKKVNERADERIKKEKAKSLPYGGDQCINQIVATRLTSTPSTRRRLDGVPLGVSHRSIRSARSRFRRGRNTRRTG